LKGLSDMRVILVLLALALAAATARGAEQSKSHAPATVKIAVMEFASKGGVTQKQMEALGDMLATEIRSLGGFEVISKGDLRSVLKLEQQRQLVGCNDESCAAEIGGALGVRWVLTGNISLFGETYLLNMKMIDANRVTVVSSVSEKIKGKQDELVNALPALTRQLFEAARMLRVTESSTSVEVPVLGTRSASRPYSLWGHITVWSGVGLLALGGTAAYMAASTGDDYDRHGNPDDLDTSRAWSATMWTGFGLGAALVTCGIVLWIIDPGASDATSIGAVPLPDGSGMAFSLGGRW